MSETNNKKREEQYFVDRFLSKEGLQYGLEPGEAPDFRLTNQAETIGLEVTRLFHLPDRDGIWRRATESLREDVVRRARTMYECEGGPPIHVSVFFNSSTPFTKQRVKTLADELKTLVIRNLPNPDSHATEEYDWINREWFPEEISQISVWRLSGLTSCDWTAPDAAFVPHCTIEMIQEVILKKAARFNAYTRLVQECWLLLVLDGFRLSGTFQLSEAVLSHHYQSPFVRLYILQVFNGEVIRLNRSVG